MSAILLQGKFLIVMAGVFCSCAGNKTDTGWLPVQSSAMLPPVDVNDVLVVDTLPAMDYVKIGYMDPPRDRIVRVSHEDSALLEQFKKEAALMGANTVLLQNSTIRYKSGRNPGTKVTFLFVRDEAGTHGGDDVQLIEGSDPVNDELLHLY